MRLPRPYIPLRVRVQVAERQYQRRFGNLKTATRLYRDLGFKSDRRILGILLNELFGELPPGVINPSPEYLKRKVELHHRPALLNREQRVSKIDGHVWYKPAANDPDYLVYLPVDDHDIETRVRGQHGDYSDLAKARKRKRKERKAERPKRKWPSRPFPKRKP